MAEKMLEVKNLSIHYETHDGNVKAVSNVSFSIDKGRTLGLVGETGAGKTTTALGIMGLVPKPPGVVKDGEVLLNGHSLLKLNKKQMRKVRGKEAAMIFQDPMTSLNPVLTVGEQIAEVIRIHEKISRAKATVKAGEMLEMVGIPADRYNEYPHQFSGGMKQRVVIAISLACNPLLLIADEPTTALDVTIQAQVLDLMNGLKDRLKTAMLLITHDLGVVAEVCDDVAIMYAGEIIEYGTLEHIFDNMQHPYTIGLFGSIPKLDEEYDRLTPIKGMMPDPANLPAGCNFCDRCPYCMDICVEKEAPVVEIEPGHTVKCHRFVKEG